MLARWRPVDAGFERLARPLLELVQRLTGLETSFVTHIDWAEQSQEVVLALNTSTLQVAEGAVLDWSDSMCRWAFLSGKEHTSDVKGDFPGSTGAGDLGMETFFALPILAGDVTLGTVCGASRRRVDVPPEVLGHVRLVAEAMAFQLATAVDSRANRQRAERAEALAPTDGLTGLTNARTFNTRFEEELARSGRHGTPIALMVINVDSLTAVNERDGRDRGDAVLHALGEVLCEAARVGDVAARIGGDDFALLLPHTDTWGAETAAHRIAAEFCQATERLASPCTLSIGISTSETTERRSLLAAADAALSRSKAGGRDRVEISMAGDGTSWRSQPPPPSPPAGT